VKLSAIAEALGAAVPDGCGEREVSGLSAPEQADARSIVFLSEKKYRESVERCAAEIVVAHRGTSIPGKIVLEVDDPYLGFARIGLLFEESPLLFDAGVSDAAWIDPTAHIDRSAHVGPRSVVGKECTIGKATVVGAGCVIENGTVIGGQCRIESGVIIRRRCVIGDRVIIQSGTVVGSEGFGNAWDGERFVRIPSFGTVIIEDDAEIGANCTIDRGALGPTVIGRGVKVDNLVHIAHNVEVGEHSAMAAQCGISGSTTVGKRVRIGGQAGFVGHIRIGDDSFVGAKAGVSKDVADGEKVTGYPARELMAMRRIEAAEQQLPAALKELKRLRARVDRIEGTTGDR
jgi:UDP-3-O-[3-hydroxymyristoyl] glucosamine N-acyltransferase